MGTCFSASDRSRMAGRQAGAAPPAQPRRDPAAQQGARSFDRSGK
jgi:hypothetical protein